MYKIQQTIEEATQYILIIANTTMLQQIISTIKEKKHRNPDVEIIVQITWNPNSDDFNTDSNHIRKRYQKFLGVQSVATPHSKFTEIFSFLVNPDIEKYNLDRKLFEKYPTKGKQGCFIQILTDSGTLLGVHFGDTNNVGGGYYTRDPFTTHPQFIIFFVLFETSLDVPFDEERRNKILLNRIMKNLDKIS